MPVYTRQDLSIMQAWPLERKIRVTQAKILEWYHHYGGKIAVSFSGGKDSTVLLDLVRRAFPDVPAVFVDTGLEYPEIREFVKTVPNVTWLRPEIPFSKVLTTYGYLHIPYTTKERTRSMENEKDYQPDILNFLEKIVQRNTLAYKEDFDVDKEILWNSAQESSLEHRSFLWMSRPCGTWCVPERETYLQDSCAYKTWTFYADQPNGIKAYRVVVDGVRDGKLAGKVIHLDYAKQVQRVVKSALPIAKVQYRDKDEYFCESSHETFIHRVLRLEENTHDIRYVPECEAELQRLLSLEHQMEKQDKRPRRTKSVTMQR